MTDLDLYTELVEEDGAGEMNKACKSVDAFAQLHDLQTKCAALETEVEILHAHLNRSETERFSLISIIEVVLDNFARLGLACRREIAKLKTRIRWLSSKANVREARFVGDGQSRCCKFLNPKSTLPYSDIVNYLHSFFPTDDKSGCSTSGASVIDSSLADIVRTQMEQNQLSRLQALPGFYSTSLKRHRSKSTTGSQSSGSNSSCSSSSSSSSSSSPVRQHENNERARRTDGSRCRSNATELASLVESNPIRNQPTHPPSRSKPEVNCRVPNTLHRSGLRCTPSRTDRPNTDGYGARRKASPPQHLRSKRAVTPTKRTGVSRRNSGEVRCGINSGDIRTKSRSPNQQGHRESNRHSSDRSTASLKRSANCSKVETIPEGSKTAASLVIDNSLERASICGAVSSSTSNQHPIGVHLLRVVEGCVRQIRDHHTTRRFFRSHRKVADEIVPEFDSAAAFNSQRAVSDVGELSKTNSGTQECTVYTKRQRLRLEEHERSSNDYLNESVTHDQNLPLLISGENFPVVQQRDACTIDPVKLHGQSGSLTSTVPPFTNCSAISPGSLPITKLSVTTEVEYPFEPPAPRPPLCTIDAEIQLNSNLEPVSCNLQQDTELPKMDSEQIWSSDDERGSSLSIHTNSYQNIKSPDLHKIQSSVLEDNREEGEVGDDLDDEEDLVETDTISAGKQSLKHSSSFGCDSLPLQHIRESVSSKRRISPSIEGRPDSRAGFKRGRPPSSIPGQASGPVSPSSHVPDGRGRLRSTPPLSESHRFDKLTPPSRSASAKQIHRSKTDSADRPGRQRSPAGYDHGRRKSRSPSLPDRVLSSRESESWSRWDRSRFRRRNHAGSPDYSRKSTRSRFDRQRENHFRRSRRPISPPYRRSFAHSQGPTEKVHRIARRRLR